MTMMMMETTTMMVMTILSHPLNIKQFGSPFVEWYGGEDGPLHFFKHVQSCRACVEILLYEMLSKLLN